MSELVAGKIRKNAWLFLNRAIREIVSHDDSTDDGFSTEVAIFSTVFIQTAFELSLVAYVVSEHGIHGVAKKGDSKFSEEELLAKFEGNELNSKLFNELMQEAVEKHYFLDNDDQYLVENFQRVRNKLVHMGYEFDAGDLYDLKYELIYFLVQLVVPILAKEESRPSEALQSNIDGDDFMRLIKFPPYAEQMHRKALNFSKYVYKCFYCGNNSLAAGDYGNEHCYSCNQDYFHVGFADCARCDSRYSLIYDKLNIGIQSDRTLKGICMNCDEDDLVYSCGVCDSVVALEGTHYEKCHPHYCSEEG
ncbi:hypothetical protein HX857_18540 [Pseudomonas gingeri]|uniref:hypothetical protein n=1 Tax=Pseudomonas gingeri TaxID=117681 RepID=UPI0015A119E1|nr:hypothetical protein [Pseudomonas gingeri]NVZ64804.1 hypothetical protein [Pseudomonas gingeri]NVZ74917.1 hypothetical protein [Pseudomonas gingeri]NWE70699.1 hypothetical protein [Pseudomonas gingeri]